MMSYQFLKSRYSKEEIESLEHSSLFKEVFPNLSFHDSFLDSWNENRKKEFLIGRKMALDLLIKGGCDWNAIDLKRKEDRSCQWPGEYVGSISHCRNSVDQSLNFFVAVSSVLKGLGVDVEDPNRFHDDLSSQFLTEEESLLKPHSLESNVFQAMVFSNKEAIYKALFPLYGKFFGFFEATLKKVELGEGMVSEYQLSTEIFEATTVRSLQVCTSYQGGNLYSICEIKDMT